MVGDKARYQTNWPMSVPARVSSPFGYRRMSVQVGDYTVLSDLKTCAYLDCLSFEIERALTSGGNCKVNSRSNNLHMRPETNTYCIHWHLEQRTGKDSINVICEDGLEKWGTRARAEEEATASKHSNIFYVAQCPRNNITLHSLFLSPAEPTHV